MTTFKACDETPILWRAILESRYEMTNRLIKRGENVNQNVCTPLDDRMTLLHECVANNDIELIRLLSILDTNFNSRDSRGRTPLHWAVVRRVNPYIIDLLINNGADVNAQDDAQMTPLHLAAKTNRIVSAHKLIARGASVKAISKNRFSVLHMAIMGGHFEMAKILISHKANVNTKNYLGQTPLICNFSHENPSTNITQLLVDNGADVNAKTREGIFSLFLAAKSNSLSSVRFLLERGARADARTERKETALHVACRNGFTEVAVLLVKFGADLIAKDRENWTPVHYLLLSQNNGAMVRAIMAEAVKREALGQSLNHGYGNMARACQSWSKFDRECREEIKQIQCEKFGTKDCVMSLLDIFSIDEDKLLGLARNREIFRAFKSSKGRFGIYGDELTKKFSRANKRAKFNYKAEDSLDIVLDGVLPAWVLQKIATHVKYDDTFAKGLL